MYENRQRRKRRAARDHPAEADLPQMKMDISSALHCVLFSELFHLLPSHRPTRII